jgi:carbon storage regulator
MLLITRRTGESIVINGSIEIKVVDVRGGRVKLGFEYPEGNTVYRQELFEKIQEENRAAVTGGDPTKLGELIPGLKKNKTTS